MNPSLVRSHRLLARAVCCASISALMLSAAVAQNIIDATYGVGAGSFELGTFSNNGLGYQVLPSGSSTMIGWTVGGPGNGVDWLVSPTYAASDGIHSVDLQSQSNSSVSTVIPTVVGSLYSLSFSTASVVGYNVDGAVSAGNLVNQAFVATSSADLPTQTYTPYEFVFTATSTDTIIRFEATGPTLPACASTGACYGPVIDGVSVVAVPEPSALGLILLGLPLVWLRSRRATHS